MQVTAWTQIVRQHRPLVWRTCYRILAHEADAADAFQETFVAALQITRREAIGNWPALLQHLATARALDHLRRRGSRTRCLSPSGDSSDAISPVPGPLARIELMELGQQLRAALAELPAQQGQAYCLRHLNDFTYEQIAHALGMSVSNVGVTLHRTTERLRFLLARTLRDELTGEL